MTKFLNLRFAIVSSICLLALLIPQYQAYAHPHVWVQVRTEIVYGPNETILGVRHNWTFDELYTTFALQGMDQNGDGTYDQKELAPLLKVNIDSLKEFGYFTFSKTGGNPISHLEPQQAEIKLDNFLISLSFFLPLEKPIKADAAAYSFSVYDPSYYISFTFENEMPMQLTSATPKGCQTQLIAPQKRVQNLMNMSESDFQALGVNFNFGGQFAQKVVLQCALG